MVDRRVLHPGLNLTISATEQGDRLASGDGFARVLHVFPGLLITVIYDPRAYTV